jgi:hypothetical protein
LLPRFSQR